MLSKIKLLIKTYKWLLLPAIPMLFFLIFLFVLIFSPQNPSPKQQTNPSPTLSQNEQVSPTPINPNIDMLEGSELEDSPEDLPGFQKKETLSSGNIVYTFSSGNPSRPNIKIVTPKNQPIFSRILSSTDSKLPSISVLRETYGEPETVIQGSTFYGRQSVLYIYATIGMAFIGNPDTNEVFEKHYFNPMSNTEYIQRFGNQN